MKAILKIKTRISDKWYNIGTVLQIIQQQGIRAKCRFPDGQTANILLPFLDIQI